MDEVFAVQVLRYLDGQSSVQDLSELKEALATSRDARRQFVRLCRLHGELSEQLAPQRAAVTETAEAPHRVRSASPRGDSESPPGAAALPARTDAPSAVLVTDTPNPPPAAAPHDDTTEFIEDEGDDTTH
jgi:hypothetical protein